ncbi:hypothetical protein LINPERPRIM_LOCUS19039 [Linum perenne]
MLQFVLLVGYHFKGLLLEVTTKALVQKIK